MAFRSRHCTTPTLASRCAYTPPSSAVYRVLPEMASACWSAWTVPGQVSSFGSTFQHGNGKFQYGPVVVQVLPALPVSKTSSRSTKTWLSLCGSTMIAWLYHACAPGVPPDMPSAEPELMNVCASARSFHGPARLPFGDS